MENQNAQTNQTIENQQEQLITDFSDVFKKGGNLKKKPVLGPSKNIGNNQNKTPNWLLEIPAKLDIQNKDLCQRKVFDQRRWLSVIKSPNQNAQKKIIATVGSVWNYLYSKKGVGLQEALNFKKVNQYLQLNDQNFIIDQNNSKDVVLKMINTLSQKLNCKLNTKVVMQWQKQKNFQENLQIKEKQLENLLEGLHLKNTNKSYIYISWNNEFFLPIGWQKTPLKQIDAFKKLQEISKQNQQLWIINSTVLKFDQSFQIKRWRDVKKDLTTVWPQYFNIRHIKKGVMRRPQATQQNEKEDRGNKCCIIQISRE